MRRWARGGIWLFGLYLATILVLLSFETRLAFPGWTFHKPWLGAPPGAEFEEVTLTSSAGDSIHAWWLPPPNGTPTNSALLYVHGNGGNLSTYGKTLLKWRNELQTGVLGFDFPGFGHSTGTPDEKSCYSAAQASFDWLVREKKAAPQSIIVVGQSMGGAIATEIASRQPCRLLLTSGTFTSFPDIAQHRFFWIPARYLVHLRFDNLSKMSRITTPVFITHGTDDHTVPFAHGQALAEAARTPKRFYPLIGHGHSQPKSREFYDEVRKFLAATKPENLGR